MDVAFFLIRKTEHTYPASLLNGRQSQHAANFFGGINLKAAWVTHLLRGTHIKHKKNGLLFFLLKNLDVSTVTFGRGIPVDGPHVVAVLVQAQVVEFKSRPLEYGVEIAMPFAVDRLSDANLILPEFSEEILKHESAG